MVASLPQPAGPQLGWQSRIPGIQYSNLCRYLGPITFHSKLTVHMIAHAGSRRYHDQVKEPSSNSVFFGVMATSSVLICLGSGVLVLGVTVLAGLLLGSRARFPAAGSFIGVAKGGSFALQGEAAGAAFADFRSRSLAAAWRRCPAANAARATCSAVVY